MQEFALQAAPGDMQAAAALAARPGASFIAGGTDLMQLWKNNVTPANLVVDLEPLGAKMRGISADAQGLRIGALSTMAEVAADAQVLAQAPALSQALLAAASPQIRNMGTAGGNLLQRTRCFYFRDPGFACNKRVPGSGCPAIDGENRELAILGGSDHCIATHPSDFPVALTAARAVLEIHGADGQTRQVALADFYRLPGSTPHVETVLRPGDIIAAILVPNAPANRRATYVKVRDRQSYAYALTSVAAGLEMQGGVIADARLAAGGVGTRPWRLDAVEAALRGKPANEEIFRQAASHAADGAQPRSQNGYKIALLQQTVRRALHAVAA
jgi:xanthine dehydrogenase YagS FAD-binding subunit